MVYLAYRVVHSGKMSNRVRWCGNRLRSTGSILSFHAASIIASCARTEYASDWERHTTTNNAPILRLRNTKGRINARCTHLAGRRSVGDAFRQNSCSPSGLMRDCCRQNSNEGGSVKPRDWVLDEHTATWAQWRSTMFGLGFERSCAPSAAAQPFPCLLR